MKPLVSLIVSVYKTEMYLEQCVDSIRNQTFRDIEIILIDNGGIGIDRCPEMCDCFAAEDERIRVHHIVQNIGGAGAGNVGLSMAQADWIMLMDSDDWMEPDAIEVLYKKTKETVCDVVIGSHYRTYMDCENYASGTPTGSAFVYSAPKHTKYLLATCLTAASRNPQMFPEDMRECHTIAACWGRLYNRKFLEDNQLKYPTGGFLHEDMMLNLQVMHAAKNVCYINYPIYHYRMRTGSQMGTAEGRHSKIVDSFNWLRTFICACGEETFLLPFLQICVVVDILRTIQRYCECARAKEEITIYTGFLNEMMVQEEIHQAVQRVSEEQIGNRDYRPMLAMLQKGDYEALLLTYWDFYQRPEKQQKKRKFP